MMTCSNTNFVAQIETVEIVTYPADKVLSGV